MFVDVDLYNMGYEVVPHRQRNDRYEDDETIGGIFWECNLKVLKIDQDTRLKVEIMRGDARDFKYKYCIDSLAITFIISSNNHFKTSSQLNTNRRLLLVSFQEQNQQQEPPSTCSSPRLSLPPSSLLCPPWPLLHPALTLLRLA